MRMLDVRRRPLGWQLEGTLGAVSEHTQSRLRARRNSREGQVIGIGIRVIGIGIPQNWSHVWHSVCHCQHELCMDRCLHCVIFKSSLFREALQSQVVGLNCAPLSKNLPSTIQNFPSRVDRILVNVYCLWWRVFYPTT